jgi:hypothetical protein
MAYWHLSGRSPPGWVRAIISVSKIHHKTTSIWIREIVRRCCTPPYRPGSIHLSNLLRSYRPQLGTRNFGRIKSKSRPWKLCIDTSWLCFLVLCTQWPSHNTQTCLYKGLSTRTSTRSKQGNLLTGLEVTGASTSHNNRRSCRFCKDSLSTVSQRSHHLQMQHKMLLKFLSAAIVGGCTIIVSAGSKSQLIKILTS